MKNSTKNPGKPTLSVEGHDGLGGNPRLLVSRQLAGLLSSQPCPGLVGAVMVLWFSLDPCIPLEDMLWLPTYLLQRPPWDAD